MGQAVIVSKPNLAAPETLRPRIVLKHPLQTGPGAVRRGLFYPRYRSGLLAPLPLHAAPASAFRDEDPEQGGPRLH
jgi:hypothetical protein